MSQNRLLAAIMNADVAGYTRLMASDETATVAELEACREVFSTTVDERGGEVVDMTGDNVLAIFNSAVEAVRAAIRIQDRISSRESNRPGSAMQFRIGLNLGDILRKDDGSVYGDGVNVAARLQALAPPGGICVSGSVRDMAANAIDVDLEDLGPQTVKNVGQPIRAYRVAGHGAPTAGGQSDSQSAGCDSRYPTVAVLPFENIGGDEEQEYLADGIAEDLLTELSKLRGLIVIARTSSFNFKDKHADRGVIAASLGARFVVHGSVRRSGARVRITADLIDAENNAQLWAQRYDRNIDDMFAIQEEIAHSIVGILPSRIEDAELRRSRSKPPDSLEAYEYLLRAKYHHHKGTYKDNRVGRAMIDRSITLDPEFAQAYAWRACLLGQAMVRGYEDTDWAVDHLVRDLDIALRLDDGDFETHRILSAVNLIQRNYDRALFHAARAQDLNPNDPRVMGQYGETLTALGNAEDAIVILEIALRVDPHQPDRRLSHLGAAQFVARRYEDALATFQRISDLHYEHHLYLSACLGQLGRGAEAGRHIQEVMRLSPDFDFREYVYQLAYREDGDREHHRNALIRAGFGGKD